MSGHPAARRRAVGTVTRSGSKRNISKSTSKSSLNRSLSSTSLGGTRFKATNGTQPRKSTKHCVEPKCTNMVFRGGYCQQHNPFGRRSSPKRSRLRRVKKAAPAVLDQPDLDASPQNGDDRKGTALDRKERSAGTEELKGGHSLSPAHSSHKTHDTSADADQPHKRAPSSVTVSRPAASVVSGSGVVLGSSPTTSPGGRPLRRRRSSLGDMMQSPTVNNPPAMIRAKSLDAVLRPASSPADVSQFASAIRTAFARPSPVWVPHASPNRDTPLSPGPLTPRPPEDSTSSDDNGADDLMDDNRDQLLPLGDAQHRRSLSSKAGRGHADHGRSRSDVMGDAWSRRRGKGSFSSGKRKGSLKSIHFIKQLEDFSAGTGDYEYEDSDITEEQFMSLAQDLSREEMVRTMSYMFHSLKQFRSLLVETKALSQDLNKKTAVNRIVTHVKSMVHAQHVVLFLANAAGHFASAASTMYIEEKLVFPLGKGFVGATAKLHRPMRLKGTEISGSPLYNPVLDRALDLTESARELLCVPIWDHGQHKIIGVLYAVNKKRLRIHKQPGFTAQDQSVAEFIATAAGQVIQNAQLYEEAITRRKHTETLLQINQLMSAETQTHKVIRRVMEATYSLINAERITLFMIDENRGVLYSMVEYGHPDYGRKLPLHGGCVGYAATTGKTANVRDPSKDWRFRDSQSAKLWNDRGITIRSALCVPVHDYMGQTVAVIEALNQLDVGYFSREEERLLESMAVSAGIIIRKSQLYEDAVTRQVQTEALLQITEVMSAESGVDRLIDKIKMAAFSLVSCEQVNLFLVDEVSHELYCHSGGMQVEERYALGAGIPGHVALTGRSLNISDVSKDWRHDPTIRRRSTLRNAKADAHAAATSPLRRYSTISSFRAESPTVAGSRMASTNDMDSVADDNKSTDTASDVTTEVAQEQPIPPPETDMKIRSVLAIPVKDYLGKTVAVLEASNKFKPVHDDMARDSETHGTSFTLSQPPHVASNHSASGPSSGPGSDAGASVDEDSLLYVPFTNSDEAVLTSLAVTAGSVLRRAKLYDEALKRKHQTSSLLRITELLSSELETDKVLERIVDASYTLIHAERISVFMVDTDLRQITCHISQDPELQGKALLFGKGIVGHVALTGKTLNTPHPYSDPRFDRGVDRNTGYKTQSLLTVPVTNRKGKVVAVIQAVNKRHANKQFGVDPNGFSHEDANIMESMAASAGIILHKAQLYEQAVLAEKKSRMLMKLVKVSSTAPDGGIEDVMERVVEVAYAALNAQRVTIYFVDHVKREIWCVVSKDAQNWALPFGKGLAGFTAESGLPLNIPDAYQDSRFDQSFDRKSGFKTKSVMCQPIKDRGKILAVMQAINKKNPKDPKGDPVAFSEGDIELAEAICSELRSLMRGHISEAVLHKEMVDPSVISLMDMYSVTPQTGAISSRALEVKETTRGRRSSVVYQAGGFVWPKVNSLPGIEKLKSLDFDVFEYSADQLSEFCLLIFKDMNLVDRFQIDGQVLRNFILKVRKKYRKNLYHNFVHGFSVLHFSYLMLHMTDANRHLTEWDVLSLLVASLCHDIDHPGNTNGFELETESHLALLYNDRSVLENHHAYVTFSILKDAKCDIFANVLPENRRALRSSMISSILSTDMAFHFENLKKLNSKDNWDATKSEERQEILNTVIHTSDLHGQATSKRVAIRWEELISAEFRAQAEREAAMNLPVAPFMQNLDDPLVRAKGQGNFIKVVLDPWFEAVASLFPGLDSALENLESNKQHYVELAKRLQAERDAQQAAAQGAQDPPPTSANTQGPASS